MYGGWNEGWVASLSSATLSVKEDSHWQALRAFLELEFDSFQRLGYVFWCGRFQR